MKHIKKDITTVEDGIIVHCVNCKGVMGSGVAKALYEKWPKVKSQYLNWHKINQEWEIDLLGRNQIIEVEPMVLVVNLYGQYDRNHKDVPFERHAEYGAINHALKNLRRELNFVAATDPIYFPYKFASGLAGGDWNIVKDIIERYFHEAIICEMPS